MYISSSKTNNSNQELPHQPFKHVGSIEVTVVVDINVHHRLGVGTDLGERLNHHPLVLKTGTPRLKDVQKDLLETNLKTKCRN